MDLDFASIITLPANMPKLVDKLERDLIARALADTGDHITAAFALLGIHRTTLSMKMKRYGFQNKKPSWIRDPETGQIISGGTIGSSGG